MSSLNVFSALAISFLSAECDKSSPSEQVSTKDGALLCRHDLTLDNSTDIAEHPEFADRR